MSRSYKLASLVVPTALRVLVDSGGELPGRDVIKLVEKTVELDDWANHKYEKSGYIRWQSILHFYSIYVSKAGFLIKENGVWKITESGKAAVSKMSDQELMKFTTEAYKKWNLENKEQASDNLEEDYDIKEQSPIDLIEKGFARIKRELKTVLLSKLKDTNPYYFEKICLILFKKMGYGDFVETKKSGDGGIDGIINQDALGLERVYIQAKRFTENAVREPEIRNFIGALDKDVQKGIFVTTSFFDDRAKERAKTAPGKIMLIDGDLLTDLMIEYGVGTYTKFSYDIQEIDVDFFVNEV